jgi:hypothetical protein
MKKCLFLVASLVLMAGMANAGGWVQLTASTAPPAVQVQESALDRTLLRFQINGYDQEDFLLNGETFILPALDGEAFTWQTGYPELPRMNRSLIIPDNARMAVRVVSSEYRDVPNVKVAPSKGHLLRTVNPATVPYTFAEVYQQNTFWPSEVVSLAEPYIMRDFRGQVVQIAPFQYNPATQTLRVYTSLTVEVYQAGIGGENILTRTRPLEKVVPEFRQMYARHFLNFNPLDYVLVDDVGPMLVITYDGFAANALPFVDWKNQKGIPTTMVNVTTIGNNSTAIKNYINAQYQSNALAYVLIVGDQAQVTSWMIGSSGCDPVYGQLVGTDHYLEVFIGRLSAENTAQVDNQITKFVEYEKMPLAGGLWYNRGLGIASNQGVGQGHYGEGDWQHMNLIRQHLLAYGFTRVDSVYDPWGTQAQISTYVNDGRSMINYCGHGSATSWGTTGFSNTQVNALTNDNKLPVITTVGCVVGTFTGTTCFCEAWLRASHNGEPSGSVTHWGSSQNQSWAPPMYAQDEYVDNLTADLIHTFGALCFNGASLMIDETGSTGNSETDHWNIFGDPSLQLRTQPPAPLSVTYVDSVQFGQPTYAVTVAGEPGALCALSDNGILLGYAYANAQGQANITISGTLPPGGYVKLTVTAYNSMPFTADVPVVVSGPDIWPPLITHTPLTSTTSSGPYPVSATVVDYSGVASATIFYSTGGGYSEVAMIHGTGNNWSGAIPGQPAGTTISYYIRAVDASPQSNAVNSPTYSFTILALIFGDNMENGQGAWTHAPVGTGWEDQWHISTEAGHSPTHAWKFGDTGTGNYANHADGALVTPTITLGSNCTLTYWQQIAAEASGSYPDSAYDGGVVEISIGGGPWTVLNVTPIYTHHVRALAGGGNPYTGPFTPLSPVFSGSNLNWTQISADLSSYFGDIQLRFRFGSDNAGNNEGWYIDDLQIIGLPGGGPPPVEVTLTPINPPIVIPAQGGSFSYNVGVSNTGATPLTFDGWIMQYTPGGTWQGPMLGPVNLTVPGGVSISRLRNQNVPGSAAPGVYTYRGYVGVYSAVKWDSSSFDYTKSAVADGRTSVGNWANWGESFAPYENLPVSSASEIPISYRLDQNSPNPFNPSTAIRYQLAANSQVSLLVYDVSGRLVATLVNGWQEAGSHLVTFDGSRLSSGLYFLRMQAGDFSAVKKMMLVK